jgi:hypothetical protein
MNIKHCRYSPVECKTMDIETAWGSKDDAEHCVGINFNILMHY